MKSIKTLYLGAGILGLIVLSAIFAPLITHFDPTGQDLLNTLGAPSSAHWLGTDALGRDVFTRLIYGARIDLTIGLVAVMLPFIIGVTLGLITGWFGGKFDAFVMRIVDTVIAFPFYVLAIALVFVFGPGVKSIIVAISLVGWVAYCRIVRANVLDESPSTDVRIDGVVLKLERSHRARVEDRQEDEHEEEEKGAVHDRGAAGRCRA